jgi:hypothetical protein
MKFSALIFHAMKESVIKHVYKSDLQTPVRFTNKIENIHFQATQFQ